MNDFYNKKWTKILWGKLTKIKLVRDSKGTRFCGDILFYTNFIYTKFFVFLLQILKKTQIPDSSIGTDDINISASIYENKIHNDRAYTWMYTNDKKEFFDIPKDESKTFKDIDRLDFTCH